MKRMKKGIPLCLSLTLLSGCSQKAPEPQQPVTPDVGDQNTIDTVFDTRIISSMQNFTGSSAKFALQGEQNTCYSPASIYMAVALLQMDAKNETAQQIWDTLSYQGDHATLQTDMKAILDNFKTYETMNMANSLWIDQDVDLQDAWRKSAQDMFMADVTQLSFMQDDASSQISNWIADKTKGTLAPTLDINDSIAAIVNALYYNDNWITAFQEEDTKKGDFHNQNKEISQVDFMNVVVSDISYLNNDTYEAVSLGMNSGSTMYVLLPKESTSTQDILARDWVQELNQPDLEMVKLHLSLPKFNFDTELDAAELMKTLGMHDAFQADKADFATKTGDGSSLYVDTILHGTHMNVNEHGVEASAYTVIPIEKASLPIEQKEITLTFDRPFVFAIMSPVGNIPLFVGVVNSL